MIRVGGLFDTLVSFENLLTAARKAQRGKRFRPDVARFNLDLEPELVSLQRDLRQGSYQPAGYRTFRIRDPKPRLISAAPYRDRVVHHALCAVLEPVFERSFIHDSYACRSGKGTHAARSRLHRFSQDADYVLKCDIRQYFPSIDHAILKVCVRRKIKCHRTLALLDLIIDCSNEQDPVFEHFPGDDLLTPVERRRGLPIGNQTSQFLANVYLDGLDHYVKDVLGCRRYMRYADDMLVLEDDPGRLGEVRAAIEEYLSARLRLRMHPRKREIAPTHCGVTFVGYRVFPTHTRLTRDGVVRFGRRLRRLQRLFAARRIDLPDVGRSVAGWLGHAQHADAYGLRRALLEQTVFKRA